MRSDLVTGRCFGGSHRCLHCLEGVGCHRVRVLVGVELNRQFSVELGKMVGLMHFDHACNEHVLGRGQDFVDRIGLGWSHLALGVLAMVLLDQSLGSLIDLQLHALSLSLLKLLILRTLLLLLILLVRVVRVRCLRLEGRSAGVESHLLFHLATGLAKHLLLHLRVNRVLPALFFHLLLFLSFSGKL